MVKPPTPISGAPLRKFQVRKDSASTIYSPASHVKSNLTVTIDKQWSAAVKRDILVIRFDHGSLLLQSIKLNDARFDRGHNSQSVAVDKEAKLLCLDVPNESTKIFAWFEDTRDFVVTVAVLQKAGFTIQMGSVDELTTRKSRPSNTSTRKSNDNTCIPSPREDASSSKINGQGSKPRRQPSSQDLALQNLEPSLASPAYLQTIPREFSPWQFPPGSKANHAHLPQVSSPLRALAPLVTPLSLDAKDVSAEPPPRVSHVSNFYRTVSVPVDMPHASQQSLAFSIEHNSASQPLPHRISSPFTTSARSDNDDSRPQGNASPQKISDYKNQMPRPRSLPFNPEAKRAKRSSPSTAPKKGEKIESEPPNPGAKRPRTAKTYKDNGSNCNIIKPKQAMSVDSSTSTHSSVANSVNTATQTLSPSSTTDFIVLMADSNKLENLQQRTLKLLEQYEADISSGYNVPRYAEFYATQIEALQTEFWYAQLSPDMYKDILDGDIKGK